MQSGGASSSAFAYTGEVTDANGLVYLRARYYNPSEGRFLTKDPSRVERNLYNYTRGNPINRVDPTGMYSSKVITTNIPLSDFEYPRYPELLNESWHPRGRWGFFMMLREVEDLSFFSMGSLKLNRLFPSIEYGKQYLVYNMCDDIYVNFMPLKYFYENEVKKQNQPNIFWRDTSVTHYKLGRTGSKIFVDGDYYSDLPQYHSVSIVPIKVLGLKLEINLIVDVNGGWHASISGGIGEAYGVSYTESYMCNSAFGLGNCNSLVTRIK